MARDKTNFNPKREDGLMAYVISSTSWGRTSEHIKWAESLKDAKDKYGWTRMQHTSITVRRATGDDVAAIPSWED